MSVLHPSSNEAAAAISLRGINKSFGSRTAVRDLNFEVPTGCVLGLLGHNGAGKSTAIGIILGQILPDNGSVQINGFDLVKDRRRALAKVGAIYEAPAFYDYLSGERNLRIYCEYTARTDEHRLREVVALVGLGARIRDNVSVYSHGMRQRLAIAQALLPKPEILILDEPTEGLDPQGILETRRLIQRLNRESGMTIVVSSHQLRELEEVCTHAAVLHEGRLRFSGEWKNATRSNRLAVRVDRQAEAREELVKAGLVNWLDELYIAKMENGVTIGAIAEFLVHRGFAIQEVAPEPHRLEDFYLETIHSGESANER